MKKLLFVIAFLQLNSFTLFAQQQNWKLNENLYDYQANASQQLFNDSVDYVQNALTAPDGSLLFYVQDGVVLTPNHHVIVDFRNIINWIEFKNRPFPLSVYKEEFEIYGFSEVSIFPNPEKCNQFYVALGANHTTDGINYNLLVWSIIEVKEGLLPTAITLNNGELIDYIDLYNCPLRENTEEIESVESSTIVNREYHLAVTPETPLKNRLLFIGMYNKFNVFKTSNNGFELMYCNPESSQYFVENLRSEAEVYVVNDTSFNVVMPYFNNVSNHLDPNSSKFSIFNVSTNSNQTVTTVDQYNIELPHESNVTVYPKGFEFSEDGLSLYVAMTSFELDEQSVTFNVIPNHNLVSYTRTSTNNYFNENSFVSLVNGALNSQYSDVGMGMIERGLDNKMYFAGLNRLVSIPNSNVPSTVFNVSGPISSDKLETVAKKYFHDTGTIFKFDSLALNQNLLIDQVDLEDATNWYQPGYLNQLPQNMVVCNLPTAVNLPVSADVYYNSSNRFSSAHFEYNSNQVFIHSPGYYKISFCNYEYVFQVIQDTIGQQGANFNWSLNNNNNQVISITTTPININGILSHVWELYELQNGTPVLMSTQTSTNATFTGLTHQTTYQIVHTIVANTTCLYNNQSIATIHTGGIINSGTSKAQ